jgi:glycosyltransferase involved in cell wall biosynthesis
MALVSVLMPVCNRETLVHDAIRSIQNQTFRDWELIILDDASTDNTLKVCRSYEAEDKRIRVLANDENLGVGAARNRLISYADGKYIAIHDSDDISVPERLAWEVQLLESKPDVGLVSGVVAWVDFDEDRVLWHFPSYLYRGEQYPQDKGEMVRVLYLSCDVPNAACMFRRSLVEQMPEPYGKYRVNEDWYFFIRAAHRTLIWGIPEILVKMNRGRNHTHVLSRYIWSLREAHRLKRDLYKCYKNDPDSPINYRLFRKSIAPLLHWEGRYIGGWKGYFALIRAVIRDPFYVDAWKSLWEFSGRAFKKGKRLATGSLKRVTALSQSGE